MSARREFQEKASAMVRLRIIAASCRRFLGIVRLTPEQRKLIEDMERDYETTLRQQSISRKAAAVHGSNNTR